MTDVTCRQVYPDRWEVSGEIGTRRSAVAIDKAFSFGSRVVVVCSPVMREAWSTVRCGAREIFVQKIFREEDVDVVLRADEYVAVVSSYPKALRGRYREIIVRSDVVLVDVDSTTLFQNQEDSAWILSVTQDRPVVLLRTV